MASSGSDLLYSLIGSGWGTDIEFNNVSIIIKLSDDTVNKSF